MHDSDDQVPLTRTRTLTAFVLFAHFVSVLALPYVTGALTGRSGGDVAQSSRVIIGLELVVGLVAVVAIAALAIPLARRPAARIALAAVPLVPSFVLIAAATRSVAERPDTVIPALDVFSLGALAFALLLSATATSVSFCALRRWSMATFTVALLPGAGVVVLFLTLALRSGPFAGLVALPALAGTVAVAVAAASAGESLKHRDGIAARESTSAGLLAATLALGSVAFAAIAAGALELAAHARTGALDVGTARTTIASAWMAALGIVSGLVGGFSRRTALVGLAARAVRAPLWAIGITALGSALLVRGSFGGLSERIAALPRVASANPASKPESDVQQIAARTAVPDGARPSATTPTPIDTPAPPETAPAPVVPDGTIQSVSGNGVTIRVLAVGSGGLLLADAVTGLARRVDLFTRCATASGTVELRLFVEPSGGVSALKPRGATEPSNPLATCTMLALYKVGFAPHGATATVDVEFEYQK